MKIVTFEVTGTSEMLQHNPSGMQGPSQEVGAKRIPTPEAEAEAGCYRLPSGILYAPRDWVRASLLGACTSLRIGKKAASSVVSSAVFSAGPLELPLRDPDTKQPISEYEISRMRAVIRSGAQKNGVLRCRPLLRKWQTVASLEIDEELISEAQVEELFARAGRVCGWGDFRVSCKGEFGRFAIRRIE